VPKRPQAALEYFVLWNRWLDTARFLDKECRANVTVPVEMTTGNRIMSTSRSRVEYLIIALLCLLGCFSLTLADARAGEAPTFTEQFNGSTLGQNWSVWDGYALSNPGDLANHAVFSMTGSHLSISFPGGVEHNMWWLKQAQVTRTYEGSGVYEIKVDSALDGSQQFGLVFENAPGTFMIFMLYAQDSVWGYVERFARVNGVQYRSTFPGPGSAGHDTGLVIPAPGPYWLRVVVADNGAVSNRHWKFQWSSDGAAWTTILDGVLEGGEPETNIGTIQRVGVFAGNQPFDYSSFDARFDYFRTYPISAIPINGPTDLTATPGNQQVGLAWSAIDGADGYSIYRSTSVGGPYAFVANSPGNNYTDLGLTNGTMYAYVVAAFVDGVKSTNSNEARATPHVLQNPGALPANGRVLVLNADDLGYQFFDGEAVTHWPDSLGGALAASAPHVNAPTFRASAIAGHGSVRFDGQNDYLSLPGGFENFTAGMTLFVVARPTALQAGSKLVLLGNGGGQANVGFGRSGGGAGLQYFTTDSASNYGWFATANALTTNEAAVFSVVQDGGQVNNSVSATVTKNGAVVGSDGVYVPPVVARLANYIGRSYWSGDGYFAGDIAEIIVYNRKLSATEQTAINTYLSEKYGLGAPPPALNAPSGLSAVTGDAQISLSWTTVSGATGYRLYRRTTSSGPYTQIHEGSATVYTDTAVVNWTTYRYVATAYNANQESPNSPEVVATPAPQPLNAPGAPNATAGNAQVSLNWGVVGGATGYRLYRRTLPSSTYSNIYTGPGTAYSDTAVTNGTTYGYVVRAFNSSQESPSSPETTATPAVPLSPPEEIPADGLVLVLDAGNAALNVTNGSEVTTWRDASGQGYDGFSVSGQAPTLITGAIGGKTALRFDGQNDYVGLPGGFQNFSAGMTLFVVARPTALQAGSKLVLLGNGAGQANVGFGRNGGSAGLQYFTTDSTGSYGWFATANALATNEAAVYAVVQDGGPVNSSVTATVSKNGAVVGSDGVYVPPVVARLTNYIGRSYWGSDAYFAGDIAEIILYNRPLSAAEQADVHTYLANKYDINLP
jgi:fibronectin type 3 domain-containing protein